MGHPWFQGHADGKILLKLAGKSLRSPREASHCAPGIEVWGIKRKGEHPKRQGVWGPQSPGSVSRRLLAPLCRADAEGEWPWLRLSARANRTEQRLRTSRDLAREGGEWVADLCPPGTGKQQQGFVEVAIPCCSRGFCVDGLPGCQPSFLGPLPSWNLPSEIKTAQLMQGCRGCLRHQAGSAAWIPALSSLGLCDWRTVLPPSPRDCLR